MSTKTKRAALYVRVSTDHQTVENQISELRQVAERRSWEVVETYRRTDQRLTGKIGVWPHVGFADFRRAPRTAFVISALLMPISARWRSSKDRSSHSARRASRHFSMARATPASSVNKLPGARLACKEPDEKLPPSISTPNLVVSEEEESGRGYPKAAGMYAHRVRSFDSPMTVETAERPPRQIAGR
jgi:hypothetical protein